MTIQDTDAVTTEDLLGQLPHSKFAKEVRTLRELEKQYTERLGDLARLCNVVCPYVLELASVAAAEVPKEVKQSADEIMDYVDDVRPDQKRCEYDNGYGWCERPPKGDDDICDHAIPDNESGLACGRAI